MSDAYQIITERITTLLEQGTVPWQQPWNATQGMPRNLYSNAPYRGANLWLLGSASYACPFWVTFKQAKEHKGMVRKGEHGVPIIYWSTYTKEDKETGKTRKAFFLKHYTVFNATQCDGLVIPDIDVPTYDHTPIERADKLVGTMPHKPTITHGDTQAYYRPSSDSVHMPDLQTFPKREAYYSTLFHELGHSTGHESRLNRSTLKDMCRFGDTNYSKEELVAEMTATYLCGVVGIENATIDNSAAYLKGWLAVLRSDTKLLVQAAAQAQKAADYIQGIQHTAEGE